VEEVLTEYRDKLTFVFRHFPLSQHKNALPSAYAAEAAGRQGRFWEMYAVLYKNQSEWQDSKDPMAIFERYAKELGLDLEKFRDDIDEDSIADKVQADYSDGIKIGIDFTPTFYLDGVKIKNPRSVTEFKELVKRAIEE
jgi:protein-disulfide isomerase